MSGEFKRGFNNGLIINLKKSSLWTNCLKMDCLNGNVFPAVRNDRIDFYHKGGKLFSFVENNFKTHVKYASVIDSNNDNLNYLSEDQLKEQKLISDFVGGYEGIKANCARFSGKEALGVSEIYHKYSSLSDNEVIVLDIEISFKSLTNNRKQDRIDILLFNKKTRTLQFVEAKHFLNKELWSNGRPDVLNQIKRYENQIKDKKEAILNAYLKSISILNDIYEMSITVPAYIDKSVVLLIFGFDQNQKDGRMDKLILSNENYKGLHVYSIGNIKKINTSNLSKVKPL